MTFTNESKAQLEKTLRGKHILFEAGNWSNYMGNVTQPNALIIKVRKEKDISDTIIAINSVNEQFKETKITARAGAGMMTQSLNSTVKRLFPHTAKPKEKYQASYSFSEVVKGDVIFQFTAEFQKTLTIGKELPPRREKNPADPIGSLTGTEVIVPAGMQIDTLAKELENKGLCLPTAAMIKYVTPVGLCGTAGHGTGRYEPAFSELVRRVRVCDPKGNIKTIERGDKNFDTLFGAHCGLLGVITEITLIAVQKFNLEEKIALFSDAQSLKKALPDLMSQNQYFTVMNIPTYDTQNKLPKGTSKWQIRLWNYSTSQAENNTPFKECWYEFIDQALQEAGVKMGGDAIQNLLTQHYPDLLPYYTRFANLYNTLSRGDKSKVDVERLITHYQTAFPKDMHDVSWIIPVKDADAGATLSMLLEHIDLLLNKAALKGEFPITYAVYVRYFKGTNGGLSTSATDADDQRVLAIDMVTNPHAPGIKPFEIAFREFLESKGLKPRFHLGKNLPEGVKDYTYFYDNATLKSYHDALVQWHGNENDFNNSPFLTPFMESMLRLKPPVISNNKQTTFAPVPLISKPEYSNQVLKALLNCVLLASSVIPAIGKSEVVKELIQACNDKLEKEHVVDSERSMTMS